MSERIACIADMAVLSASDEALLPEDLVDVELPFARIETITPERALWLFNNRAPNRQFNPEYANAITNGGPLYVTPDAISIDINKGVDNGQHRLYLISRGTEPVKAIVLYHESPNVFVNTDTGKKRTLQQTLGVLGYKQTGTLAAATVLIYTYMRTGSYARSRYEMPTSEQGLEWISAHRDDMEECVSIGGQLSRSTKLSPALGASLAYLFGQSDRSVRDDFVGKLGDPQWAPGADDPIYSLRRRLLDNAQYPSNHPKSLAPISVAAFVVTSWNFYNRGETKLNYKWTPSADFPVIMGVERDKLWPGTLPRERETRP